MRGGFTIYRKPPGKDWEVDSEYRFENEEQRPAAKQEATSEIDALRVATADERSGYLYRMDERIRVRL